MKRFLTALAVAAVLIAGPRVYAIDCTWVGAPGGFWCVRANWVPVPFFPGGGVPPRVTDRAVINIAAAPHVQFAGGFPPRSRTIQEMRISATAPNAATGLDVIGGKLRVRHTEIFSGAAAAATATLTVTDGIFRTDDLVVDSTDNNRTITITVGAGRRKTIRVSGETLIKGTGFVCDPVNSGSVIDLGLLIMEAGSAITHGGNGGVCQAR